MSQQLEDYVSSQCRIIRVHKHPTGDELVLAECPICGRSEKAYVNPTKRKWNCYSASCNGGGHITSFVMAVEGISFIDAARRMMLLIRGLDGAPADVDDIRRRLALMNEELAEAEEELDLSVPLPPGFRPCYNPDTGKFRVPPYIKRRLSSRAVKRWNIGYCTTGRYAGRVVIPVECDGMLSFVARDMTGNSKFKYLNPGTLAAHYLMGYDRLDPDEPVHCVEGSFDCIRWDAHGFNTVAYFGAFLRQPQVELLKRLNPPEIVLVPDAEAYKDVLNKSLELLPYFKKVSVVDLRDVGRKADPDTVKDRDLARELVSERRAVTGVVDVLTQGVLGLRNAWE